MRFPPAHRLATLLAAGLALALLVGAAQAQWTWRDKDGRITASDLPPPRDIPEKDILTRPAPRLAARPAATPASAPAPSTSATPSRSDRELEARRRAADDQKATQSRADEEKQSQQRAENCRRARGQLAALDSGQRMARVNDKGEREILDDKGRAEEQRRAREVISADCR